MNIVDRLSVSDGLCACGVCAMGTLLSHMDDRQRLGLSRLIDSPRSVLVALFPYLTGAPSGNLSLYARGRDYHAVIADRLGAVAKAFQAEYPDNHFVVLADDSPLPEVYAAACAGLGCIGDNGLLIHPDYGSYVFIGTIVTDLDLPVTEQTPKGCLHCGACRRACPVELDKERCLSALTQQGGTLTEEQAALVREHPLVWGCDTCQLVCPMNKHAKQTDIPDFRQSPIDTLTLADVDGLTRRQFCEKYPDRAFTWRGPAPLRRNLTLKEGDNP